MPEAKRATRVQARVREELATLVARELSDPRVQGAIVSRVEMSDDLKIAKVYVRRLEGAGEGDADAAAMVTALKKASPMLRREVTQRVGLRYAPELRFFYDSGQDARDRIEELLEDIKRGR
jgi:ribosome-binding factor A